MIKAQNLVVEFPIYDPRHRSVRKTLIQTATGGRLGQNGRNRVTIRSLDNVSFEFKDGDRVGLIGHNGSGKTTLLRVLCGVYEPIAGELEVTGRVVPLLDIMMGFDHDATGYENILLRGIMLGVDPQELRPKISEIAEFSGLGDYLNLPLRTYSTGMLLRLAFSVSTSIDADILLMDEWLSVGDAEFNKLASARLDAMIKKTSILVLASHDVGLIHKVCNVIIHLEHGRIIGCTLNDPKENK